MKNKVKIQQKTTKNGKNMGHKCTVLFVNIPHKLAKKRGFEKGNELIFLEPEELAKIEKDDIIIRKNNNEVEK